MSWNKCSHYIKQRWESCLTMYFFLNYLLLMWHVLDSRVMHIHTFTLFSTAALLDSGAEMYLLYLFYLTFIFQIKNDTNIHISQQCNRTKTHMCKEKHQRSAWVFSKEQQLDNLSETVKGLSDFGIRNAERCWSWKNNVRLSIWRLSNHLWLRNKELEMDEVLGSRVVFEAIWLLLRWGYRRSAQQRWGWVEEWKLQRMTGQMKIRLVSLTPCKWQNDRGQCPENK